MYISIPHQTCSLPQKGEVLLLVAVGFAENITFYAAHPH